jgi:hypothetical protein
MSEVDKQGLPKWVFRFLKVPLQDPLGALMGACAAIFATSGLLFHSKGGIYGKD